MTTESKKLQTVLDKNLLISVEAGENFAGRLFTAAANDARILHEALPVMRQMEECLKVCKQRLSDLGHPGTRYIDDVRAAAKPFLED